MIDENKMRNSTKYNFILKSEKDNSIEISLQNTQDLIEHFWYGLSLCHSCSIQQNEDGTDEYICVSPDSIEFVKTAKIKDGIFGIKLGKGGLFRNDTGRLQLIDLLKKKRNSNCSKIIYF